MWMEILIQWKVPCTVRLVLCNHCVLRPPVFFGLSEERPILGDHAKAHIFSLRSENTLIKPRRSTWKAYEKRMKSIRFSKGHLQGIVTLCFYLWSQSAVQTSVFICGADICISGSFLDKILHTCDAMNFHVINKLTFFRYLLLKKYLASLTLDKWE